MDWNQIKITDKELEDRTGKGRAHSGASTSFWLRCIIFCFFSFDLDIEFFFFFVEIHCDTFALKIK